MTASNKPYCLFFKATLFGGLLFFLLAPTQIYAKESPCFSMGHLTEFCDNPGKVHSWGGHRSGFNSAWSPETNQFYHRLYTLNTLDNVWRLGGDLMQDPNQHLHVAVLVGTQISPWTSFGLKPKIISNLTGDSLGGGVAAGFVQQFSQFSYGAGVDFTQMSSFIPPISNLKLEYQHRLSPDSTSFQVSMGLSGGFSPDLGGKSFISSQLYFNSSLKDSWRTLISLGYDLIDSQAYMGLGWDVGIYNDELDGHFLKFSVSPIKPSHIKELSLGVGYVYKYSGLDSPPVIEIGFAVSDTKVIREKKPIFFYPSVGSTQKVNKWTLNLYQIDSVGNVLSRVHQWKGQLQVPKEIMWNGLSPYDIPLPPSFYRSELWVVDLAGRTYRSQPILLELEVP